LVELGYLERRGFGGVDQEERQPGTGAYLFMTDQATGMAVLEMQPQASSSGS
jgi:hypothetical protein